MSHEKFRIHDSKSNINATSAGAMFVAPYFDQVGIGDIPGSSIIHKFGYGAITSQTLVPVASNFIYRTPTTPATLEIVSSDAADNATGIGAREVTIIGIGSDWKETTTTVIPNGLTPVAIDTTFLRIYRMYVSGSGSYATATQGSHVGTLTVREAGAGQDWTEIPLFDSFPFGQTVVGVYTVPKGKTAVLLYKHMYVEGAKPANLYFFRRENADQITAPFSPMRILELEVGLEGKTELAPRAPVSRMVGPCDVGFMARVSAGTSNVTVDFELYLENT